LVEEIERRVPGERLREFVEATNPDRRLCAHTIRPTRRRHAASGTVCPYLSGSCPLDNASRTLFRRYGKHRRPDRVTQKGLDMVCQRYTFPPAGGDLAIDGHLGRESESWIPPASRCDPEWVPRHGNLPPRARSRRPIPGEPYPDSRGAAPTRAGRRLTPRIQTKLAVIQKAFEGAAKRATTPLRHPSAHHGRSSSPHIDPGPRRKSADSAGDHESQAFYSALSVFRHPPPFSTER
jgi:hypothetical protein